MSSAALVVVVFLALGAAPALGHGGHEHGAPVRPPGGTYTGPMGGHDHATMTGETHTHGVATSGSGPDHRTRVMVVLGFVALNLSILAVVGFVRAYRPPRPGAA